MSYPAFRVSQGRQVLALLRESDGLGSSQPNHQPEMRDAKGESNSQELIQLFIKLREILSVDNAADLHKKISGKDKAEGQLSIELYNLLKDFSPRALGDPDFWRYISVAEVSDFIFWRDGQNCSEASFGLSSSRTIPNCVPLRMFNRAHLAFLAAAPGSPSVQEVCSIGGSDFWQSHVLRVQTRFDPDLVRCLVSAYQENRIPNSDFIREVAKKIKVFRANIILILQDKKSIKSTSDEIISSVKL